MISNSLKTGIKSTHTYIDIRLLINLTKRKLDTIGYILKSNPFCSNSLQTPRSISLFVEQRTK